MTKKLSIIKAQQLAKTINMKIKWSAEYREFRVTTVEGSAERQEAVAYYCMDTADALGTAVAMRRHLAALKQDQTTLEQCRLLADMLFNTVWSD
jgi:hypothetical protein